MDYKNMRVCVIARKMGISLEDAEKLKAGKEPVVKMKIIKPKIEESEDVKTDL